MKNQEVKPKQTKNQLLEVRIKQLEAKLDRLWSEIYMAKEQDMNGSERQLLKGRIDELEKRLDDNGIYS